jgi:hypothetical protein
VQQKKILENLDLLIVKNQWPLQFVENIWFNIWFNTWILDLSSLPKNSFLKKYYHTWWGEKLLILIYIYIAKINKLHFYNKF